MEEKSIRKFYDLLSKSYNAEEIPILMCELTMSRGKFEISIGLNPKLISLMSEYTHTSKKEVKSLFDPVERSLRELSSDICDLIENEPVTKNKESADLN